MTKTEWVKNIKTGSVGQVLSRYTHTVNGKRMVEVRPLSSAPKAYWLEKHTETAE